MIHDAYITKLVETLERVSIKDHNQQELGYESGLATALDLLFRVKENRQKLFFCGNGGSAGIAQHMTADFLKNGGLATQSLYNQATLTCLSNDLSYENAFSKQLELLAGEGDLLIAVSSSGNSPSIIRAIDSMKKLGGQVVTLTGFKEDNQAKQKGDYNIYVPIEHYGIVESIHTIILQQLVDLIVERDGVAIKE